MKCRYPGCRRGAYVAGRWCSSAHMIEPRYCTCYGDDTPSPTPEGECPACRRIVESHAVA